MTIALLAGLAYGAHLWHYFEVHVSTDDAFIEANVSPASARVGGPVIEVLVEDNQEVKAGTTLLRLDPRDYQFALEMAEARLHIAEGAEQATRAAKNAAGIEVAGLKIEHKRKRNLLRGKVVSQEDFEQVDVALRRAQAAFQVAVGRQEEAQGRTREAQAKVEEAREKLADCTVRAPIGGRVTKLSAEVGQVVQPGQRLAMLVDTKHLWVVANYKETQLTGVHPGQSASFVADIYPDTVFKARVDSLQAGTGSRFALLPPENASGNFVKVVQRIPVKLTIESPTDGYTLFPGMSVVPTIDLE
ncbi:HlyD family secretion protein [Haliangium sp.]|uniref:HlyD family secretion protein n=1 Tax=Haliangium sp. TaxID=2663208 RepID=UPI003D0AF0B6